MKQTTFFLIALLWSSLSLAAPINLPKDASGWTIFTPSDDSRICYVSAADSDGTGTAHDDDDAVVGADPFNPTGDVDEFPTFAAAYAATRSDYPDWILLKRGETWTANWGQIQRSGRGATEPFLIGAYGASGTSPVVQTGADEAWSIADDRSYFAIAGIDFYAHLRDPGNGGSITDALGDGGFDIYMGTGESTSGLLIEGCKFRYYESNRIQNDGISITDVRFYRCLFLDNYEDSSDHSQGLYSRLTTNLIIQECVFAHNGWYQASALGDDADADGQATQYNHNIYFASPTSGLQIKDSVFLDPSASSIKITAEYDVAGLLVQNNLLLGGDYGISMCANYEANTERIISPTITNNVLTQVGRLNATNQEVMTGLYLGGLSGGTVGGNLIINHENTGTTAAMGVSFFDGVFNATISGNIIYNIYSGIGITIGTSATDSTGMVISGNDIQMPANGDYTVWGRYALAGDFTFTGDTYYSNLSDGGRFAYNNVAVSDTAWISSTSDDYAWEEKTYPAPTRDVDTYMASIGETGTIDAFIAAQRAQDRYNWDSRLEADTVNDWIRAGFGINTPPGRSVGTGPAATVGTGPGFTLQ